MHRWSELGDLASGCCGDRAEAVLAVKQLTVGDYERHRWAKGINHAKTGPYSDRCLTSA